MSSVDLIALKCPEWVLGNLPPQLAPSAFFLSSRTCTGDLARPELPSLRACCPRNHGRGNRLLTEAGALSLEARKLASSGHWTLPDYAHYQVGARAITLLSSSKGTAWSSALAGGSRRSQCFAL